jgi:3-hydroxy-3-methylglutaryl CoA synthase/uncharacterized OB-fold protein
MVGITSYGAYVPMYRLRRDDIAKAWGGGSGGGERSVANFDEDSITMAVAAALDCIRGQDRSTIDAVYFATTTGPYQEKQMAVTIAAACDLRSDIYTADVTDSLRAGTLALKAAMDAVKAGSAHRALVVASDCRIGEAKSEMEQSFGDGAVAFIVGDTDVLATFEASYYHSDEIYDVWRTKKDNVVRAWEDRYVVTEGYARNMGLVVPALLKKAKLTVKDFNKVIYYAQDGRRHAEIARTLGFDYKNQVQDPLSDKMGNTGTAYALMMLVAALETAQPGQRFLLVSYGDGAEAHVIKTTENVTKFKPQRGMKGHLASKRYLNNYERYIRFRDLMPVEKQRRPPLVCSVPAVLRDRKWIFNGCATKCNNCGRLFFPAQRVCNYCQTKDKFEYVRIMDWTGVLFTFSKDNLAQSVDPPTVWTLVDMNKQVRVYTRMTDFDPDKVALDMTLEMSFRKLSDAGEHPNYFWMSVPVR